MGTCPLVLVSFSVLFNLLCIIAAWMVIGLIGAFIFIFIQLILLIDFAHGWAENWVGQYEETGSKTYYVGQYCCLYTMQDLKNCLVGITILFHKKYQDYC